MSLAEQFFSHHPDSTGPMLQLAIDTLHARHANAPFVAGFIAERGLPLWDEHRSFPNRQGRRVLRVPVRAAGERTITGLIDITFKKQQPHYSWKARGAKLPGISARGLETIFWGYEQQVFGKTHTDEGERIVTKIITDLKQSNQIQDEKSEVCYDICVDWYCGPPECYGGGGNENGDDGGFGGNADDDRYDPHGGGSSDQGGGSPGGGAPDSNSDPVCREPTRGHSMVPPQNTAPSNPNLPTCVEDDEDENRYPDNKEIKEFEKDYRDQMTKEEIEIFDEMSRYNQLVYLYNAKKALDKARYLFPNLSQHNDKADAFRHAYFSMENVEGFGYNLARKIGDAHEEWDGNPTLERQMDLFNNKIGRDAYSDWSSNSNSLSRAQFIKKLADNGKLTIIKNDQLVPSDN